MRIVIAQLNFHVGNFENNLEKIISSIIQAEENKADVIIFPELSITGYPPRDFLNYSGFMEKCRTSIQELLPYTYNTDCIVGTPWENPKRPGKALYNAALHLSGGEICGVVSKALLPTYDIFDEYRYFQPGIDFRCIVVKGHRIALTICEDLWNIDNGLYPLNPMDFLIQEKPEIMINIAASPFFYGQKEARLKVLKANVIQYQIPLIYVNQVGAQTELIFDGGSLALNAEGEIVSSAPCFMEAHILVERKDLQEPQSQEPMVKTMSLQEQGKGSIIEIIPLEIKNLNSLINRSEFIFNNPVYLDRIHKALILGIRDFFRKSGFQKAVIGLSGGIDSALVAALAVEALGPDLVLGVLMPSQYSSNHSLTDAYHLSNILGIKTYEIPIESITQAVNSALIPYFEGLPFSLAEENIQSRTRGIILMAIANKLGHILLNTSNKSEGAVGYGTLYGDLCGAISVIGDLYKSQVFSLCRFLNQKREIIPVAILDKAPSAELRPDQKDSDSLPEYADLDPILMGYIEENLDYEDLLQEGFPGERISKTLGLVNRAEFKRYQSAPILRISPKAFGMGRRMPIVGKYDQ